MSRRFRFVFDENLFPVIAVRPTSGRPAAARPLRRGRARRSAVWRQTAEDVVVFRQSGEDFEASSRRSRT